MATIAGLPYVALKFDKAGKRQGSGPIRPAGVTDLIVISHGWHQDPASAEAMYEQMLKQIQAQAGSLLNGRTLGVIGIYWPSDKFKDNLALETVAILGSQGAAAAASGMDADKKTVIRWAGKLAPLFGMKAQELKDLATYAANGSKGDMDKLVKRLREQVGAADNLDTKAESADLLAPEIPGRDLIAAMSMKRPMASLTAGAGGAAATSAGGQAPAAGIFSGLSSGVAKLLNQFAYFELKKRAGTVGKALGQLLQADGLADVQRLHLIGHSFGARLVTAATAAMTTLKPYSLSLVQGAFSHNAFGVFEGKDGAFRSVVASGKVSKRMVVTHTWNDEAVGLLYAVASRASNDIATGLVKVSDSFGGAKDKFGGLGANGALFLKTGEGVSLVLDGASVPTLTGKVNNCRCDFIGGHTDIETPQVGRVLAAAIA